MKTIALFIFGLLTWLLLTNYQLVYSKATSFANQVDGSNEDVPSLDTNASSVEEKLSKDITEEELSNDSINSEQDKINSLESELSEKTRNIEGEMPADNTEHSKNNALVLAEKSDEKSVKTEAGSGLENEIAQEPKTKKEEVTNNTVPISQAPMSHPWLQQNKAVPMYNPNIMSPNMYMNPMAMMMPMMMNMMGPMMNPAMMMNPMAMMNHPLNTMTHPQNMNAMMMSMDPKMMFSMFGQPSKEYLEGKVPEHLPVVTIPGMPTQTYHNWPINKVSPGVSREAKKNAFQTVMAMSPLSMRDMLSIMADKMPVDEGVSWDDAVEAMKLRANEVNFKFVGSSPLWKQIEAETEQPSAKVEMFRFCDARMARKILDVVPEFIIFLPCKIALLEDAEGKLWVMTMDWDVSWMDFAQNPNNHLSKEIRENAQLIRDNLHYIMEGAATGDF